MRREEKLKGHYNSNLFLITLWSIISVIGWSFKEAALFFPFLAGDLGLEED